MIHYNVWFSLKDGVHEGTGLAVVGDFLRELCAVGEVSAFRLLRNSAEGPRTRLPRFHAVIEFPDDAALSLAMRNQGERGIHAGGHERIVDIVGEFRVEIFRLVAAVPAGAMGYACEI
jgi:hypothetical protein